ncbi:MAG TPA: hypothetical protein ENK57_18535 [Polyangiaceae bacterium]|nr:hypothetical protein [Polyangiaceae bacterium]
MFGLGFGEMVLLGIVLLVVVGPKELPKLLKSLGKGINKLKTMSQDLRDQSGIDEILEDEGLREDLQAIRSIARPGSMAAGLVNSATKRRKKPVQRRPAVKTVPLEDLELPDGPTPDPAVEMPLEGPDAYGALADDAPLPAPANDTDDEERGPSSTERPTAQVDGADEAETGEPKATAKEGT